MAFTAAAMMNPITRLNPSPVLAENCVPRRSYCVGHLSLSINKAEEEEEEQKKRKKKKRGGGCGEMWSASAVSPSCSRLDSLAEGGAWREIQGDNNWEGLVNPFHPLLRREIVRYAGYVAACYKAFDLDPTSPRYLNCKYGKGSVLERSGVPRPGYRVTKYVYATAETISTGRWIGYVAVSTDEETKRIGRRDVLVAFRGTVTRPEWIVNMMGSLTPARFDPHNPRPDVKVEAGFLSLYTSHETAAKTNFFGLKSCRDQLLSEISRLLNEFKFNEGNGELSITIAGHSMGSSLGLLLAYDIAELGLNRRDDRRGGEIPVTVFSFAGPRVGNWGFKKRCEELGIRVLRIVNKKDPFTKMPGVLFNEKWSGKHEILPCYAHVGVELGLDFLTTMKNPRSWWCVHDIETYIDLLLHCSPPSLSLSLPLQSHDDDDDDARSLLSRARQMLLNVHDLGTSSASAVMNSASVQSKLTLVSDFHLMVGQMMKYGMERPNFYKRERAS